MLLRYSSRRLSLGLISSLYLVMVGCASRNPSPDAPVVPGNEKPIPAAAKSMSQSGRYNKWFRDYTEIHLPNILSPRWPKAVALAESALKSNAKSTVGAMGLMQFMPSTWAWIAPDPWKAAGPMDPEAAIWVGCRFLRWNWDRVTGPTTTLHRKSMVNSAYNSGLGWLIKARDRCQLPCDRNVWDENVENRLVTNAAAQAENRAYVKRIRKLESQLLVAGEFL